MLKSYPVYTTLPVTDFDRARAFYKDILGLEETFVDFDDRWAQLQHGGTAIALAEGEFEGGGEGGEEDVIATLEVTDIKSEADRLTIQQIAAARADIVGRARNGKLKLADLEGGTFTISNLGMYGIERFIAVLNPPQAAILAVGATEEKAVVIEGEVVVRPRMELTLTCDHRAVDGATGAEFLRDVKAFLEEPGLAL